MAQLGYYLLLAAFVVAVYAVVMSVAGARRRSILIGYFAEPRYASHLETAHLRNVRMDTSERFDP